MRMRKKKNLLPRMERCENYQVKDPFAMKGHWRELMETAKEVHLELGCGKGRFTAETAAQNPDVLLIAVEMVPDAMVVAMERCRDAGLTNVFFVCANARELPEFFESGEVDRIYLNFSDPWPKKGYYKRRLTYRVFLEIYKTLLKDGGILRLKTDNVSLFDFSLEEFEAAGMEVVKCSRDLHASEFNEGNIMTEYETNFSSQGMPINFAEVKVK